MFKKIIVLLMLGTTNLYAASPSKTPWEIRFNNYAQGLPAEVVDVLKRIDGFMKFKWP